VCVPQDLMFGKLSPLFSLEKNNMFWRIVCPVIVASQVFPEALDDDVTLLQSRIGTNHAEVKVQPIQNQAGTDASLASVAKYVSEMEIRRGDGDGSWNTEEKTALETMKTALTDQFKQFLDDDHADDGTTWTARKSVHQVCITHASNDFGTDGAVTAVSTAVTLTKNKHKGCRKSEKSWNDYKDLALSTCAGASDFATDRVHEIYSHHETLAAAMNLAKTQAQDYANLAEVGSKRECNSDQLDYENKWCEWRDDRGWACAGLEGCIAQVDLAGLKSSLLVRSSNRRMLWLTIEKLLCRIDHLLTTFGEADTSDTVSDFNTTDTCDAIEADPTKFVLSLDIPSYTPCSDIGFGTEPGAPTCSAWLAQEYTWPTTTHVVPTICQTSCPAVTFTTPTPHAGCASDSEKCSLYTAHPDVCGEYDGDLGVTSTDCCACATTNFIAVGGCPTYGLTSAFEGSATAVADVQCCALVGAGECFRATTLLPDTTDLHDVQACGALTAKTFAEAEQICSTAGKRLCTTDEVADSICCNKGCGFNDDLLWATNSAN